MLNSNHEKRSNEQVAQQLWAVRRKTKAQQYTQITGGDVLPITFQYFASCTATHSWPVLGHCVYVCAPAQTLCAAQKEKAR